MSDQQDDGDGQADESAGWTSGETVTILGRMLAAGMGEPRAREHLSRRAVHLDGELVTAPDAAAASPTRRVINPALPGPRGALGLAGRGDGGSKS